MKEKKIKDATSRDFKEMDWRQVAVATALVVKCNMNRRNHYLYRYCPFASVMHDVSRQLWYRCPTCTQFNVTRCHSELVSTQHLSAQYLSGIHWILVGYVIIYVLRQTPNMPRCCEGWCKQAPTNSRDHWHWSYREII